MNTEEPKSPQTPPCEGENNLSDKQTSVPPAAESAKMSPVSAQADWGVKRAFKTVLCRYCKFDGRASRPEFWYLALGNFIIIMCINVLMTILTYTCANAYGYTGAVYAQHFSNLLVFVYSGFMLMPGLSLCVRRLQDSGKDWKWLLLALIPVVGLLAVVYFLCLPSGPANQYGEGPADPAGDDEKMPPFVASVVAKVVAFVGVVCRAPGKWAGILGGGFALLISLILLTGHFFGKPAPTLKLGDSGSFGESKSSSSVFNFFGNDLDEAVEMLMRCEVIDPLDVGEMRKDFLTGDLKHDNLAGDSSRDFLYNYKMFKDGHRKLSEHDYILDIYNCWRKDKKKHLPLDAVKAFIEEGSALNGKYGDLCALDFAADAGHTEIVELMLEHGADASSGNSLICAAGSGHIDTVKLLLGVEGINVNANILTEIRTALNEAVENGHTEVVKLLLAAPGIKVTPHALHTAVDKGNPAIVKLLLDVPSLNVNELYSYIGSKISILERAVIPAYGNGNIEIIKHLLSVPNIDVNSGSKAPISRAESNEQYEVVNLLLAQPGIKIPAQLVHDTIKNKDIERLKTFMAVPGFDVNNGCPLLTAVSSKKVEVIKLLLSTSGIDVNKESPLAEAVRMGSLEIVKLLTETPGIKVPTDVLRSAVKARNVEIVKLLLTVPGIDINGSQEENKVEPVLMCALDSKYGEVNIEIVKLLLAVPGIDVNQPIISKDVSPGTETTPLYKAVEIGRTDIVQLLLEAPEINIFQGYESGRDALSKARNSESLKLIQEAVEKLHPHASKYTEVYHYMKSVRLYYDGLARLDRIIESAVGSYNIEKHDGKLGTDAQALIEMEQQYKSFIFNHVDDIESILNQEDKKVFEGIKHCKDSIAWLNQRKKSELSKQTHSRLSQLCSETAVTVQSQSADSQESPHQDAEDNAQQPAQSADSTGSDDRSTLDPLIQRMRDLRCRQSDSKLYQKRLLTLLPKIREGADVNLTLPETKGNTALHYACAIGSLSITQWLLEHGANPNAVTNKGKTPLQCVGSDNRAAIIKLLKEYQAR